MLDDFNRSPINSVKAYFEGEKSAEADAITKASSVTKSNVYYLRVGDSKYNESIVQPKYPTDYLTEGNISQTYPQEISSIAEQASTANEGSDNMDEGIKMLLERLERDSREREERYHADAKEREERYRNEMKEREERSRIESKEREERILRHFDDGFSTQKQLLETKLDVVDSKLSGMDQNIGHLRNEMTNITARMDAVHGRVDSIKIFIWTSVIAMIIGIIGIVYANWQVISAMLQMSSKE